MGALRIIVENYLAMKGKCLEGLKLAEKRRELEGLTKDFPSKPADWNLQNLRGSSVNF